jgi:hypothetical protein
VAGHLHRGGGHPALGHHREQRLQVGASGVVSELGTWSVPILISTPPIRPVWWPAARSPASIR